jgi:hypothetical protein
MKATINGKVVDISTITISAKCSDLCYVQLLDKDDRLLAQRDGYVPKFMPENGPENGGDYVVLDIDLETGIILNWKRPSKQSIEQERWE